MPLASFSPSDLLTMRFKRAVHPTLPMPQGTDVASQVTQRLAAALVLMASEAARAGDPTVLLVDGGGNLTTRFAARWREIAGLGDMSHPPLERHLAQELRIAATQPGALAGSWGGCQPSRDGGVLLVRRPDCVGHTAP